MARECLNIKEDYLQARLNQDWEEFERSGRPIVAKAIPRNYREVFHGEFRKLKKNECHEDVLLACLYVFLNSRKRPIFPWAEDIEAITSRLDGAGKKIKALRGFSGIATMTNGDRCWDWDRGFDLDDFEVFRVAQKDLLWTMDQYMVRLQDLCRSLPRKDIVRQYGQIVIWTYIGIASKSRFSKTSSLTESLLGCFCKSALPKINWVRDIKRFQNKHPLFCEKLHAFLSRKHDDAASSLGIDWKRFLNLGLL
jgi:hypothetical protein